MSADIRKATALTPDMTRDGALRARADLRNAEELYVTLADLGADFDELQRAMDKVLEAQAAWNLAVAEYASRKRREAQAARCAHG